MSLVPLLQATVRPLLGPLVRRIRLARARRVLMRSADGVTDCGALFDLAIAALDFAPLQHRSEFVALMVRAAELAPRVVVEVGSYAGGTAFLLAVFVVGPQLGEMAETVAAVLSSVLLLGAHLRNHRYCKDCRS